MMKLKLFIQKYRHKIDLVVFTILISFLWWSMLGSVETFKIKPHETTHAQINSNFGCLDNEITIFNQSSKFNGFDAIAQTECLNWSHTPSKEENLEMNKLHSELEIQNNSFVYYLFLVYVIGQFVIVIFFLIFFFFKNKSINIR